MKQILFVLALVHAASAHAEENALKKAFGQKESALLPPLVCIRDAMDAFFMQSCPAHLEGLCRIRSALMHAAHIDEQTAARLLQSIDPRAVLEKRP